MREQTYHIYLDSRQSCRVLWYSKHSLPHALDYLAHSVANKSASPFAVPAQSRQGQAEHRVCCFSIGKITSLKWKKPRDFPLNENLSAM